MDDGDLPCPHGRCGKDMFTVTTSTIYTTEPDTGPDTPPQERLQRDWTQTAQPTPDEMTTQASGQQGEYTVVNITVRLYLSLSLLKKQTLFNGNSLQTDSEPHLHMRNLLKVKRNREGPTPKVVYGKCLNMHDANYMTLITQNQSTAVPGKLKKTLLHPLLSLS